MTAVAEGKPAAPSLRVSSSWGGWGRNRDDAADYGRLAARFKGGMQPVSPDKPKAFHIPGQIPLFDGNRRTWRPVEEKEETASS
jgi:hypothetical protein